MKSKHPCALCGGKRWLSHHLGPAWIATPNTPPLVDVCAYAGPCGSLRSLAFGQSYTFVDECLTCGAVAS